METIQSLGATNIVTPRITPTPKKDTVNVYVIYGFLGFIILILGFVTFNQSAKIVDLTKKTADLNAQKEETLVNLDKEKSDKADLQKELEAIKNPPVKTNYFPVKFLADDFQKVGQTLTLQEGKLVSAITLQGNYGIGDNGMLTIYEATDLSKLNLSPKLGSGKFAPTSIINGEEFKVILDAQVDLKPNVTYFILIETTEKTSEAGIAFMEGDTNKTGQMVEFTRLSGGNGELLAATHSWQPRNSQDIIFELN